MSFVIKIERYTCTSKQLNLIAGDKNRLLEVDTENFLATFIEHFSKSDWLNVSQILLTMAVYFKLQRCMYMSKFEFNVTSQGYWSVKGQNRNHLHFVKCFINGFDLSWKYFPCTGTFIVKVKYSCNESTNFGSFRRLINSCALPTNASLVSVSK